MPPDVFLALASSGITLVASLLFFVSDDRPPREIFFGPSDEVAFCLPPLRVAASGQPPPLPASVDQAITVSTPALLGTLSLRPSGDEWVVSYEGTPQRDVPAVQLHGDQVGGAAHDLRWHGRVGMVRPMRASWRQKPGRA